MLAAEHRLQAFATESDQVKTVVPKESPIFQYKNNLLKARQGRFSVPR
jgi:hypothetical protein